MTDPKLWERFLALLNALINWLSDVVSSSDKTIRLALILLIVFLIVNAWSATQVGTGGSSLHGRSIPGIVDPLPPTIDAAR